MALTLRPAVNVPRFGGALLAAGLCLTSLTEAQIAPGTRYPSAEEQYTLQLLNHARASADGLSILSTLVSNNLNAITPSSTRDSMDGTAWSTNFWASPIPGIAYAMNFFHVHPGDLKRQYLDLDIPGAPLAWNANLGNVATGYNNLVVASRGTGAGYPHSLAPYGDQSSFAAYAKRYTDGGYGPLNDLSYLAENIAPNNYADPLARFAAFMIDWGSTPDGIQDQDPDFGSHRLSIMDLGFTEVGLGTKPGWDAGAVSETQEFGDRFSAKPKLVGAVFFDRDQDGFYTEGEGLGGVTIKATPTGGGAALQTVSQRSGGYALEIPASGTYAVTATGGFGVLNLGNVTMSGQNVLLDILPPAGQAVSDFNRDAKTDFVLFDPVSNRTRLWFLNGAAKSGEAEGASLANVAAAGWKIVGTGDFNGDGYGDYVLFNPNTLRVVIWMLQGATLVANETGPLLPAGWSVIGVEDFNRDGHPDLLLYNTANRQTVIWYLDRANKIGSAAGPTFAGLEAWRFCGFADFNADSKPDFLFYNSTTRKTIIWYMDDNVKTGSVEGPTLAWLPAAWSLIGVADFNSDGQPDYLLNRSTDRQCVVWVLNGLVNTSQLTGPVLPAGWELLSPK